METKTFAIRFKEKELKVTIREPKFEEISFAYSALITNSGRLDLVSAGKCIFDTCKVECDEEIIKNPRILIKLCLQLTDEYVMPFEEDFKKK